MTIKNIDSIIVRSANKLNIFVFAPLSYRGLGKKQLSAGCPMCACEPRRPVGECVRCPTVNLCYLTDSGQRAYLNSFFIIFFIRVLLMFLFVRKVVWRFQCHRKSIFRRIKCLRWYWSHVRELYGFSLAIQISFVFVKISYSIKYIRSFLFFVCLSSCAVQVNPSQSTCSFLNILHIGIVFSEQSHIHPIHYILYIFNHLVLISCELFSVSIVHSFVLFNHLILFPKFRAHHEILAGTRELYIIVHSMRSVIYSF